MADEVEAGAALEMREILGPTGQQAVEYDNLGPGAGQSVDQVRADEARAARDQYPVTRRPARHHAESTPVGPRTVVERVHGARRWQQVDTGDGR